MRRLAAFNYPECEGRAAATNPAHTPHLTDAVITAFNADRIEYEDILEDLRYGFVAIFGTTIPLIMPLRFIMLRCQTSLIHSVTLSDRHLLSILLPGVDLCIVLKDEECMGHLANGGGVHRREMR